LIATCLLCGVAYSRDPSLEVACVVCGADVGRACVTRRPSEHVHSATFAGLPPWGHDARELLAAAEGKYHLCSCGVTPAEARRRLDLLLAHDPGGRWKEIAPTRVNDASPTLFDAIGVEGVA
jgi:hypothetical protein